MMVSPSSARVIYSSGPNCSATLASWGARMLSITMLNTPPMNEQITEVPSASPALPFLAMGWASKVVQIEDGVPGMASSVADTEPPAVPPQNAPTSMPMPVTASIP